MQRQSYYWDINLSTSNLNIYACYVILMFYQYTSFVHQNSGSTPQFINGKPRDFQKPAKISEWNYDVSI